MMSTPRDTVMVIGLLAALGMVGNAPVQAPAAPPGNQDTAAQPTATASGVIQAEANLVLVDVVASDKKENYVRDLDVKEFHVYEDDKELPIASFSHGSEAKPTPSQPRYLVLFFDNSTMSTSDQPRARQAAAQFVEKSAAADLLMAVVDFTGASRITQSFTASADTLKRAVSGVKFAALQPNEPGQTMQVAQLGGPSMLQVRSDFAARSVLLSIRNLAKTLRTVPGRKTLILFSGGFPLNAERQSELTATIDAANKANVAIYPVDVRGLEALSPMTSPTITDPTRQPGQPGFPPGAELRDPIYPHDGALLAALRLDLLTLPRLSQRPGGGGGGTGGTGGGGGGGGVGGGGGGGSRGGGGGGGGAGGGGGSTGGGSTGGGAGGGRGTGGSTGGGTASGGGARGGGGSGNPSSPNNNPYRYGNTPQQTILPPLMDNISTNQQVLYALAAGTGGFTIFNTNDFLQGLNKISQELNEYYVLGYVPPSQAHVGAYHRIEVKTDRKGVKLRHRNGYYDVKSPDLLAGKPEGRVLEEQAASTQPGEIPVSMSVPYFYTGPDVARVNLSLEIPSQNLAFEKDKGKFHSQVHVLGIARREDNSVAARFSDAVTLDMEKKELKEFTKAPFTYQNTFNIASGKYTLKIVLSAGGQKFGKYEMPLVIEPFNGNTFNMSGVALSNKMQPVSQLTASIDAALLEERTPLVVRGTELTPSPNNHFKRDEKVGLYVEVYEPLMANPNPPRVGILYNITDRKTNQQVYASNTVPVDNFMDAGSPLIPVGILLPVENLQAGDYRVEVRARDAAGNASSIHAAEFALE
ncbi:MAG: VWA domain-containing protein [Terriglobia bacterium]